MKWGLPRVIGPYIRNKDKHFAVFIGGPSREYTENIIRKASKFRNLSPKWSLLNLKLKNIDIPPELEREGDYTAYMVYGEKDLMKLYRFMRFRRFLDNMLVKFHSRFFPTNIPRENRFQFAAIKVYKSSTKAFEKFFKKNGGVDVSYEKIQSDWLDKKF